MLRLVGLWDPNIHIRLHRGYSASCLCDPLNHHITTIHGSLRHQLNSLHFDWKCNRIAECLLSQTMVQADKFIHPHLRAWTDYPALNLKKSSCSNFHRWSVGQGPNHPVHAHCGNKVHTSRLPRTSRLWSHSCTRHADWRLLHHSDSGLLCDSAYSLLLCFCAEARSLGTCLGSCYWQRLPSSWLRRLHPIERLGSSQQRGCLEDQEGRLEKIGNFSWKFPNRWQLR